MWTPSTSRTALRSALAPSMTTSTPCSTSRPRSTRLASSVVATVAFSVEPSQSPSGCLTPSVSIPSATTQQRPLSSIPSSISDRQAQVTERAAHQLDQVLARARHELARYRRLARRAGDLVDLLADRLARARIAARRDAGEHPLEHHVAQGVARREVRIGRELDLVLTVDGARPRPAHRHALAAERDLAALVAMPHRGAVGDVAALCADDLVDLGLHQLVQHPETRRPPTARAVPPSPHQRARRAPPAPTRAAPRCVLLRLRPTQPLRSSWRLVLLSSWTSTRTRHGPNRTGRGGRTAASSSTRSSLRWRLSCFRVCRGRRAESSGCECLERACGLADLDQVPVRIADVAADLGVRGPGVA